MVYVSQFFDALVPVPSIRRALLQQGYIQSRLKSSFLKLYGRQPEFADPYDIIIYQLVMDLLPVIQQLAILELTLTRSLEFMNSTTVIVRKTGDAYLSRAPDSTPV